MRARLDALQRTGAFDRLSEQRQRADRAAGGDADGGVTQRTLDQQLLHMQAYFADTDANNNVGVAAGVDNNALVPSGGLLVSKFEAQAQIRYAETRFVSDFQHHYSTVDLSRSMAAYEIRSSDDLRKAMAMATTRDISSASASSDSMRKTVVTGTHVGVGAGAGAEPKSNGFMLGVMREMVDAVNSSTQQRVQAGAMMAALLEHGNRKRMEEMHKAGLEHLYYVELDDDTITKEVANAVDPTIRTFAQYMDVCDQTHPDRDTRVGILQEMVRFARKWSERPAGRVDMIDVFVTHAVSEVSNSNHYSKQYST